jgi:hypothetical protein
VRRRAAEYDSIGRERCWGTFVPYSAAALQMAQLT